MQPGDGELVIEAGRSGAQYWRDLWRFRELLYFLAWRDIKVRYKQTAIGVAWVLVRPLLTLLILTVVFHRIAKLGQDVAVAYPLLVLAGLLPWQLFSMAFSDASSSLVGNAQLISKVYFPRLLVPIGAVLAVLVDFLVTLLLLVPLMAWYGHWPGAQVVFLPLFLLLCLVISLGAGIFFAAVNVRFRDVRYVIPFVLQFGLYLSPVGFAAGEVSETWRWLFDLNPLVGVIEGFRWCLIGGDYPFPSRALLVSVVVAVSLPWLATRYFRRVETSFADIV